MNVLIGYTGFIGSSLNQEQYHLKLNSKNWDSISEPIDADRLVIAVHSGGVLNLYFVIEDTLHNFYDLKDVKIYEKPLNKEKILKKIKKKI